MYRSKGEVGTVKRRMALLASGTSLVATMIIGGAGPAPAAECPPDRLLCRLVSSPTPVPVTTPTTTPAPTLTVPALPPSPPAPTAPRSVPEAAQRLLDLANGDRAKAGLGPLASRGDVTAIALEHSYRMVAAGNLFHNDSYFSDAVKRLLNSQARGENVAQNSSVDDTHTRLMNSPGHRANILDPRFSVVGFAVVQAPDGRYYTTQNFLQPAGGTPAAPAKVAAPAPRSSIAPSAAPTRAVAAAVVAPAAVAPVPSPAVEVPAAPPLGAGAEADDAPSELAGASPLTAASTRSGLPGKRSTPTWVTAALLLALVALGTLQVGRGVARSALATR